MPRFQVAPGIVIPAGIVRQRRGGGGGGGLSEAEKAERAAKKKILEEEGVPVTGIGGGVRKKKFKAERKLKPEERKKAREEREVAAVPVEAGEAPVGAKAKTSEDIGVSMDTLAEAQKLFELHNKPRPGLETITDPETGAKTIVGQEEQDSWDFLWKVSSANYIYKLLRSQGHGNLAALQGAKKLAPSEADLNLGSARNKQLLARFAQVGVNVPITTRESIDKTLPLAQEEDTRNTIFESIMQETSPVRRKMMLQQMIQDTQGLARNKIELMQKNIARRRLEDVAGRLQAAGAFQLTGLSGLPIGRDKQSQEIMASEAQNIREIVSTRAQRNIEGLMTGLIPLPGTVFPSNRLELGEHQIPFSKGTPTKPRRAPSVGAVPTATLERILAGGRGRIPGGTPGTAPMGEIRARAIRQKLEQAARGGTVAGAGRAITETTGIPIPGRAIEAIQNISLPSLITGLLSGRDTGLPGAFLKEIPGTFASGEALDPLTNFLKRLAGAVSPQNTSAVLGRRPQIPVL